MGWLFLLIVCGAIAFFKFDLHLHERASKQDFFQPSTQARWNLFKDYIKKHTKKAWAWCSRLWINGVENPAIVMLALGWVGIAFGIRFFGYDIYELYVEFHRQITTENLTADEYRGIAIRYFGIIAGAGAIIGYVMVTARNIIANKQNKISEQQRITESLGQAITHIGAFNGDKPNIEVRLGGLYSLQRIMKNDSGDEESIAKIFSAYIRENAKINKTKQDVQLREDVQAALEIITEFNRGQIRKNGGGAPDNELSLVRTNLKMQDLTNMDFAHFILNHTDFSGAVLVHTCLIHASLQHANFTKARLMATEFLGAKMQYADLTEVRGSVADFTFADLSDAKLTNASLSPSIFYKARLYNADLSGADLSVTRASGAKFDSANLSGARLYHADLSEASLSYANLSDANLENANLNGADLRNAKAVNANLMDAKLKGARVRDVNLENANLSNANLKYINLIRTNLKNANLAGANLDDANLNSANLESANLEGANLRDVYLGDANLEGANLKDADLTNANLENANLKGASLSGAKFSNTNLKGTILDENKQE